METFVKIEKCEKCGENEIGARFLGKDICMPCYDKVNNLLSQIK